MIFVWNGKQAGALTKAQALTKGYELDGLLARGRDPVLQVFFSGGVVRGRKLQRSNVLVFETSDSQGTTSNSVAAIKDNPNAPSIQQILKAYETVYLLKWLFPESAVANVAAQ
jgi:ABC-type metal ion transport system substrate-binding protein